ncbi:hypothetical protein D3C86_1962990 [compost metagenome]
MVRVRSLEKIEKHLIRPSAERTGCRIERNQASCPVPRNSRTAPAKCSPRVNAFLKRCWNSSNFTCSGTRSSMCRPIRSALL